MTAAAHASNAEIRRQLTRSSPQIPAWLAERGPGAQIRTVTVSLFSAADDVLADHGVDSGRVRLLDGVLLAVSVTDTDTTWRFEVGPVETPRLKQTFAGRALTDDDGIAVTRAQLGELTRMWHNREAHELSLSGQGAGDVLLTLSTQRGSYARVIDPDGVISVLRPANVW